MECQMSSDLSRLLRPKSIALFGGGWSQNVLTQLQKSGFSGEIWPVHPKRESICGIPCIRDVSELPGVPDASFIGVNRELTVDVVSTLSKMGAGGAICFASGFLESEAEGTGGAALQERLVEAAGNMPILGPNCYGLINYLDNVALWPDQHGGVSVDKGVAIIGQSSNVAINMTMQKRSLPLAYFLAAGNQAQTSLSDMATSLLEDERVTTIGLYIEGFGDIRDFEAMAQKAKAKGIPIVALKTGKTEKSKVATMTHTASLAGGAETSSALLRRLGIVEVNSIAVFLETLKLLNTIGPLPGNTISSVSCSGGEATLMADLSEGSRLDFREFTKKQHDAIKSVLGPIVTIANPLDYHTFIWGDTDTMKACFAGVMADGFDLNVFVLDFPRDDRCDPSAWECAINAIIGAKQETGANVAVLSLIPENLPENIAARFLKNGICPINGMEEGLAAIDAAIRAGELAARLEPFEPTLVANSGTGEFKILDEAEAKPALSKHGLQTPRSISASSADELVAATENLSFPVVLKGLGIAHKSEAGAVVLNLQNPQEVCRAAARMNGTSGFLAEEMIENAVAEILVGVTRDETGMILLTIGAGGVLTELVSDASSVLLPASRQDILEAIQSLKSRKLLEGFRGKPAADMEALLDAVMAVQDYAINNYEILEELDINPLIALPKGAIAVDALIKLREKQT